VPATVAGTLSGLLYFDVPGVDREVADALEAAFDGNGDFAGGTITWTAATGTLSYAMPVRGC
jgi:hypothetical protein